MDVMLKCLEHNAYSYTFVWKTCGWHLIDKKRLLANRTPHCDLSLAHRVSHMGMMDEAELIFALESELSDKAMNHLRAMLSGKDASLKKVTKYRRTKEVMDICQSLLRTQ